MTEARIILAIDGGGTKTEVVVGRHDGSSLTVLGRRRTPPINLTVDGVGATTEKLGQAIQQIAEITSLPPNHFDNAVIALAGAARPDDRQAVEDWAHRRALAQVCTVLSDIDLVMAVGESATESNEAVVALISGTGAIAVGKHIDDETTVRAGGWGYLIGDDGGGYWMGRSALRAVLMASEGRAPATALTGALLGAAQVASPRDLLTFHYQQPNPRHSVAALAAVVNEFAEHNDEVAKSILTRAGEELAALVLAVLTQLEHPGDFSLTCSGGVLVKAPLVVAALKSILTDHTRIPRSFYLVDDPVLAAANFA